MSGIENPTISSNTVSTPVDEWSKDAMSAIQTSASSAAQDVPSTLDASSPSSTYLKDTSQIPAATSSTLHSDLSSPAMPGGLAATSDATEYTLPDANSVRQTLSAAGETAAQYVPSQVKEQAYALMRECPLSHVHIQTDSASKADLTTEPTINEYEPSA